jgi:hypothetical protein
MKILKALIAGFIGGFIGNGIMGAIFSSPPITNILYDPSIQSELFIEITKQRNIPISVAGLVILSGIHGILYNLFYPSLPGNTWKSKGLFWGFVIWLMYWLFQEWFIYNTLLGEPLLLNLLELAILLLGSLAEGFVIAAIMQKMSSNKAL